MLFIEEKLAENACSLPNPPLFMSLWFYKWFCQAQLTAYMATTAVCLAQGFRHLHFPSRCGDSPLWSPTLQPNVSYFFSSHHTVYLCVCVFTLHTASRSHAGLEILSVGTRHAEVQLGLQHPLPHPAAFFTRSAATRRPGRPAWVDTRLRCVI